jgi:superfamily II DNA or RNA helicase
MPLVYLPGSNALFSWGDDPLARVLPELVQSAVPSEARLVSPSGVALVRGLELPLFTAASQLAVLPAATVQALPGSHATWALASKLAFELAARERVVPTIARHAGRTEARWAAALSASEDADKVSQLARFMPPAAHALPSSSDDDTHVWAPEALLRAFLDAVIDALVRSVRGGPLLQTGVKKQTSERDAVRWEERWQRALSGPDSQFEVSGFGERSVLSELERWSEPAVGARDRLRTCFRLELPERDRDPFVLRFLLQSPDDPSLRVPASDAWRAPDHKLTFLGRSFPHPEEALLQALGRAARLFTPIATALERDAPESVELDPAAAFRFLSEGAAQLAEAGFGIMVPAELTASGQRRLRLRMRVGGSTQVAGVVAGSAALGMEQLLEVDWQAAIGDHTLSARELASLAAKKAPLVRFRGAWVAIDPGELLQIQAQLAAGPSRITLRDAVQAALSGETQRGNMTASVATSGSFAAMIARLQDAGARELAPPDSLKATLRPYQQRGLAWLATMSTLGLGACLADDMGLGKTIQLLSYLLWRRSQTPLDTRPALLVAPTSVVGNWEREAARFAPSLHIVPHFGMERAREVEALSAGAGSLVVTTYGVLRRDAALLSAVAWSVVVLDEAQNIKNAASSTARAARALPAAQRFALTGTPVENRLAELWSILEFANPGLLGPIDAFRRSFALPIERYGDQAAAQRLRRLVSPFLLRRVKSDPSIIEDLPAKNESKVFCTLTREQATLYRAVVDEELRRIAEAEGIERRGRVLALLTYLKQICNHPAHYLGERGALAERSGKLARVSEMLEEAMAAGDKALLFTQFRGFAEQLAEHLTRRLGVEVLLLHGGTSKKARDAMVQRFQEDEHGPRIFVLSLKAGGTGLNLTAANHVFHYDRWWNPAVEDQATDRAYRIGQKRNVQVHKLVCSGTVEDKIDQLLEQKRALSAQVVGSGEQWITELGDGELRELFALSDEAVVEGSEADEVESAPESDGPAPRRAQKKRAAPKRVGSGSRS